MELRLGKNFSDFIKLQVFNLQFILRAMKKLGLSSQNKNTVLQRRCQLGCTLCERQGFNCSMRGDRVG